MNTIKTIKKEKNTVLEVLLIIFFLVTTMFILSSCGNTSQNPNQNQSNIQNSENHNIEETDLEQNNTADNNENKPDNTNGTTPPANNQNTQNENTISEFSTKILTKSKNRANNIKITCDKINGMEVKPGETFSFCGRTGVSKESDGYKKADVIVGNDTVKALGGGNCQVSSTLYNAVLNSSELEVTERHPHGKKVNYVPEGKDAAIAHGSKDFKFKNNSNKTLKIYASSDNKSVSIRLAFIN